MFTNSKSFYSYANYRFTEMEGKRVVSIRATCTPRPDYMGSLGEKPSYLDVVATEVPCGVIFLRSEAPIRKITKFSTLSSSVGFYNLSSQRYVYLEVCMGNFYEWEVHIIASID
mmetsp:Transcript_17987/g.20023  ORF Transcript_17987/g.20023 Transcript_17987/m.20023 type:complete len:114 (+) Transcript_17987:1-342(+)